LIQGEESSGDCGKQEMERISHTQTGDMWIYLDSCYTTNKQTNKQTNTNM